MAEAITEKLDKWKKGKSNGETLASLEVVAQRGCGRVFQRRMINDY